MTLRIQSGGQTGLDRAALDVAMELGLERGGWCPKGRKAEEGVIPERYPLKETPSADYPQRTEWNVRDSDGTLILNIGEISGGTALTVGFANKHKRPCLVVDLATSPSVDGVLQWIEQYQVHTLNVAGPRESKLPGIHDQSVRFLRQLLNTRVADG